MKPQTETTQSTRIPWNKGKLVGQKHPLKLKGIWAIRIRLQIANNTMELALFNLAIDSKLRGCDLVQLKVSANTLPTRTPMAVEMLFISVATSHICYMV
jgi:hypothetical protein